LPVAHTCSKELELPLYDSKELMAQKFEIALGDGLKGFFIGWVFEFIILTAFGSYVLCFCNSMPDVVATLIGILIIIKP